MLLDHVKTLKTYIYLCFLEALRGCIWVLFCWFYSEDPKGTQCHLHTHVKTYNGELSAGKSFVSSEARLCIASVHII